MSKRTDPTVEAEVITLWQEGKLSQAKIGERVGLPERTVGNIIKRAKKDGFTGGKTGGKSDSKDSHARDKDTTGGQAENTGGKRDRPLEAVEAIHEVRAYLNVTKMGYNEAKNRTYEKDPNGHEKTWQQTQYLKLYRDAVKMLIVCTGLDNPTPAVPTISPLDELAKAIESYREDE